MQIDDDLGVIVSVVIVKVVVETGDLLAPD
jgi:hypothetical protein